MKTYTIKTYTTEKMGDPSPTEDAVLAQRPNLDDADENTILAVSDGAGGYGIFATDWAEYLLSKLPSKTFGNFDTFKTWTDEIWEEFYKGIEERIKEKKDIMVSNKFNKEGSDATLIACWIKENRLDWCFYGDSALFVYNKSEDKMRLMTQEDLSVYDSRPSLINWKNLPKEEAYKGDTFELKQDDIILLASDALSCYISMAYYAYIDDPRMKECTYKLAMFAENMLKHNTQEKENFQDKESLNFYTLYLEPLLNCADNDAFRAYLRKLYEQKILLDDDFSLVARF